MVILIFLILICHTVFLYLIFSELEKALDNTFNLGRRMNRIENIIRKGKK